MFVLKIFTFIFLFISHLLNINQNKLYTL